MTAAKFDKKVLVLERRGPLVASVLTQLHEPIEGCLSKFMLFGPISSICEKNKPPVSEVRDSEISTICLWLFFSYTLISNQISSKSTDSYYRRRRYRDRSDGSSQVLSSKAHLP